MQENGGGGCASGVHNNDYDALRLVGTKAVHRWKQMSIQFSLQTITSVWWFAEYSVLTGGGKRSSTLTTDNMYGFHESALLAPT